MYTAFALLFGSWAMAQTDPVDDIFNRYSEREGFTYVSFSGKMLGLLAGMEAQSGKGENVMLRLKSIRILSEDDSIPTSGVNFYTELSKKLDLSVYEELMVVKEGQDVTKFLIRQTGDKISELLVISGGRGGNALISIKGDINLKEISRLSKTIGVEELEQLEEIDKKEPGKQPE